MKPDIHPNYNEAKVICVCGSVVVTKSTRKEIHVDICSSCHPYYTGKKQKEVVRGRVEKFKQKYKKKVNPQTVIQRTQITPSSKVDGCL